MTTLVLNFQLKDLLQCVISYPLAHIANSMPWQQLIYFIWDWKNKQYDIDVLQKYLPNSSNVNMEQENIAKLLNPGNLF